MFGSTRSNAWITVCYLLLLVSAGAHIAYGYFWIRFGSYMENQTNNHQQYLNNLPLGSFTITIGCYLIVIITILRLCMSFKFQKAGQFIIWTINWLNCAFTFAVAVLLIREYVFQQQLFHKYGHPLPEISQFKVPYYLGLIDALYTFIIAFPVTLELVYLGNYRMLNFQLSTRLFIQPSPQQFKTDSSYSLQRELPAQPEEEEKQIIVERPTKRAPIKVTETQKEEQVLVEAQNQEEPIGTMYTPQEGSNGAQKAE